MKKIILASVVSITLGSSSVFAHHPAAEIVDPEIYAMIDENVADTPHADLDFSDMGSDSAAGSGGSMSAQDVDLEVVADVDDIQSRGAMGQQR